MNQEKTKLILGSAGVQDPLAITLDIAPEHNPDILHDLNQTPWPFHDNQFREIICHHVLEHLNDLTAVMEECHRICDEGGTIHIEVPHHSNWIAHSPEHKLRFNFFSLDGYLGNGRVRWMTTQKRFKLLKREVTFHKAIRQYFLHKLFNRFPLAYERFWAYILPAEHLKFTLTPIK